MRLSALPLVLVLSASVAANGCATPRGDEASGRPRVAAAAGARPRPTRHATVRYDLAGRPFDLPLVHGTLEGRRTIFLLDTGANVHIVGATLARRLGLAMTKTSERGSDHLGMPITTWRIDSPRLVLDEWGPLAAPSAVVTEIPKALERLGIGGILSPQKLATEGDAVVLDLYRGEIRDAWWKDALLEIGTTGVPLVGRGPKDGRACEEPDRTGTGLAYVLPASIEGQAVSLLLDTGAQRSDLFVSSPAGQTLLPRSLTDSEPMYAASGKFVIRRLPQVSISAGAFSAVVDVGLVEGSADSACKRDGVLAMDVLRACTLLLGRSHAHGTCATIDGAPRPRPGADVIQK